MAYLMDIALDNARRLRRKTYFFEYKGFRFKLVQDNPRKWSDHLMTILPQGDHVQEDRAFMTAAEFASALSWENGGPVAVHYAGARGWPDELPLTQAMPSIRVFPRIASVGVARGYDLYRIPHIRTQPQRIALSLFREATASNNVYLSFLFFWQVLEVDRRDPVGFINKTLKLQRARLSFTREDFDSLPLGGRTLGLYLQDDCRHAIAHIKRKPGKRVIELDRWEERSRVTRSTRVVEAFARFYIDQVLGLSEVLYLTRRSNRNFPAFADLTAPENSGFRLAYYPPPQLHLHRAARVARPWRAQPLKG
jgi:hypothetical protein